MDGPENLDTLSPEELFTIVNDGDRNVYVRRYALYKQWAIEARKRGETASALSLEASCDAIYEKIPEEERW